MDSDAESRYSRSFPFLIVFLGLAFTFKLWARPGILYSGHSDVVAQEASLKAIAQRSLRTEGRWPVWDPSSDGGMPAHADTNAMYAYPLHWLFWILPLDRATNWAFVLNILLAGISMYFCARRFLNLPASSFFCAAAYMLSYRHLALIDAGWLPQMGMYALFPLLFLTLDRLLENPCAARTGWFAVVAGLCVMQGSMQTFYYAALGLSAFAAYRLLKMDARCRARALLCLAGGSALGMILAAPDLLPRWEFMSLSTRTRMSYSFFLDNAPGWSSLKTLIDPMDQGGLRKEYWENNFYFGIWLYPLCLLAAVKDWRRSRALLAAMALCLFLCFDSPVLKFFFYHLPGFHLFRRSTRLLQIAQFLCIMLAGLGADSLLGGIARKRVVRPIFAGILLSLPVALDSGLRVLPRFHTLPLSEAFPEPAFYADLRRGPSNGRVAAIGRTSIPYGMVGYYGIDLVNGYSPLNLRHFMEYFDVLKYGGARSASGAPAVWADLDAIAKPDMLRALDVRHVVSNADLPLGRFGYSPAGRAENVPVFKFYEGIVRVPVYLWNDKKPLGAAYFASEVRPVADEADSLREIEKSSSVLRAGVLGWDGREGPLDFSGGRARMVRRGYNVYAYEVESRGRNFLILSQVWYPGWRARIDGKEARLYRTNHALLGCVVPQGKHILELEMTSPKLKRGLALSAAGVLVLAMLFLRRARDLQE